VNFNGHSRITDVDVKCKRRLSPTLCFSKLSELCAVQPILGLGNARRFFDVPLDARVSSPASVSAPAPSEGVSSSWTHGDFLFHQRSAPWLGADALLLQTRSTLKQ
jgi:hypothetical protein